MIDMDLARQKVIKCNESENRDPPEMKQCFSLDEVEEMLDEIEELRHAAEMMRDEMTQLLNCSDLCWHDWHPSYEVDALIGAEDDE